MERVTLSFKDGVTRSPSVIACTDNSLAVSVGMVYEGEFKPIQKPKELGTIEPEVIYIHHFKYTHYIAVQTVGNNKNLVYTSPSGSISSIESMAYEISNMTSIGNTLIATTDKGMRYYLWKNDSYIPLGLMPKIDAEFKLTDVTYNPTDKSADLANVDFTNKETLSNALSGVVYKTINDVKELGCFMFPFWVRLAYRLYDGRNIMVTSPVLMLPSVVHNKLVYVSEDDFTAQNAYARYYPAVSSLWIKVNTDLSNWGDIISGIDVYLSDDVNSMELDKDWEYKTVSNYTYRDKVTSINTLSNMVYSSEDTIPSDISGFIHDNDLMFVPQEKTERMIIDELIDKSVFYRAAYIENPVSGFMRLETYLKGNSILYLTTQHQLEHDDYFNHCKLTAESMISYNGRVQISNITRWFFEGFKTHLPLYVNQNVNVYVKIETQSGTRVIHADTISNEAIGYYYFFPDPRAKEVFFVTNNTVYTRKLTEHPHLNGAYFLDLPSSNFNNTLNTGTLPSVNEEEEYLSNTIMVSDVNNPFLFTTEGTNQIPGDIINIAVNTDALSEGQFGEHPLIAFTSEGIWGLTVNKEGYYETADPMSRDICEGSVIQTDSNIFFMSKKGLMMITGRKVTCVSEQLIGKPNPYDLGIDLPINAKMAYDYKNSRLWIIGDSDYVYIFSMKTGTFAQYLMEDHIKSVHNLYPDNIFQTESGKILSLDTLDINSDSNSYNGVLISRPIKMMDILSYKSIEDLECHYTGENAEVTLYGSTDHINWYQVPHFKSKPWKYFVLKIELSNFMANDVFSGITLAFKPKRVFRLHPETNVKENEYNELMSNI